MGKERPKPEEKPQAIETVVAQTHDYTARGDVEQETIVLRREGDVYAAVVLRNGMQYYLAPPTSKREEAERVAREYVARKEAKEREIIHERMATIQRALGFEDTADVDKLLGEMCERNVGLRRGWVRAVGKELPDIVLPKCETKAQAAIVLAKRVADEILP